MTVKLLFVDDEQSILHSLERIFLDDDYEIFTATSGKEGLNILEKEDIHVVIADYRMQAMTGIDFLRIVAQKWPNTIRIILSGYSDISVVMTAINDGGVYKFIEKPWHDADLRLAVVNAATLHYLQKMTAELTEEVKQKNEEIQHLREALSRLEQQRIMH